MIITNIGGPVTVGQCHLAKGANEVQPALWSTTKEHRLVQAFLKSGRLIEGAAAMPPRGVLPPGAVPHDPANAPPFDPRAGIPTPANLGKAPPATPAESPKPETEGTSVAPTPEAEPAAEEAPAEEPPAEAKDPTEYAATDARLIVKDCTSVDQLQSWKSKETRKTVIAEIDTRLAELEP